MQPYTFSFNNINSAVYGLEYDTLTDSLAPNRRNDRIDIDYRHGSYASGSGVREDRVVSFRATWRFEKPLDRHMMREISYWLKDAGKLVFDIEPDKYYNARLDRASQIALARLMDKTDGILRTGSIYLQFVCKPFAFSEVKNYSLVAGRNRINYNGTQEGHPIILIRNNTSTPMPVSGFRISAHKQVSTPRSKVVSFSRTQSMIKRHEMYLEPSFINVQRFNFMPFNRPDLVFDRTDEELIPPSTEPSNVNIQQFNFMRFNTSREIINHTIERTEEQNAIEIDIALGVGEAVRIDNLEETITLIKSDTTEYNIRHLLSLPYDKYLTLDRDSSFIDVEQAQAHDVQVAVDISEVWL